MRKICRKLLVSQLLSSSLCTFGYGSSLTKSILFADIMLDKMIANNQLETIYRDQMRQVLLRRHKHQYEQQARHTATNGGGSSGGFLSAVRSISDIGRSFSHGRNLDKSKFEEGN